MKHLLSILFVLVSLISFGQSQDANYRYYRSQGGGDSTAMLAKPAGSWTYNSTAGRFYFKDATGVVSLRFAGGGGGGGPALINGSGLTFVTDHYNIGGTITQHTSIDFDNFDWTVSDVGTLNVTAVGSGMAWRVNRPGGGNSTLLFEADGLATNRANIKFDVKNTDGRGEISLFSDRSIRSRVIYAGSQEVFVTQKAMDGTDSTEYVEAGVYSDNSSYGFPFYYYAVRANNNTYTASTELIVSGPSIGVSSTGPSGDTSFDLTSLTILDSRPSGPGLTYSTPPTSIVANTLVHRDYVLGTKQYTGKQALAASVVGEAKFLMPNGSTPSSPVNGDMWQESNHLWMRLNGVTRQIDQQGTVTETLQNKTISGSNNTITNVSLTTGVTNRLPYANLTAPTAAARLLGRRSVTNGDWEEITLGNTLTMGSSAGGPLNITLPGSDQGIIYRDATANPQWTTSSRLLWDYTANQLILSPNTEAPLKLIGMASNPSTLANGNIWHNSTTNHLYVRLNGTTYQLDQQAGGISGSTGSTDRRILIANGTGGATLQNSLLGISSGGSLIDSNGNELIDFTASTSAINQFSVINSAAGNAVQLVAAGGDTDIQLKIDAKGNSAVQIGSSYFPSIGSTSPQVTLNGTSTLAIYLQTATANISASGDFTINAANGTNGDDLLLLAGEGSSTTGNISFYSSPTFGGGERVIYMRNARVVPTSNPTNGGLLYIESGALKYRGSSGTVTTIANP